MPYQEFNLSGDYVLSTLVILVLSFAYYYYKYRNTRNTITTMNISNTNRNDNNQMIPEIEEEIKRSQDIVKCSNHMQSNHNERKDREDINRLKIFTLINGVKKEHLVNFNIIIADFIKEHLIDIPIPSNSRLVLICKGKRLDPSLKFTYYSVTNNTIIHGFFIRDSESIDNNRSKILLIKDADGANQEIYAINNAYSVSIFTIAIHSGITVLIGIYIIFSKNIPEMFPKTNNVIFGLLTLIWLTQVSKTLAKLYVYRLIVYE